jgi:preprotein translocase subunit Sss1
MDHVEVFEKFSKKKLIKILKFCKKKTGTEFQIWSQLSGIGFETGI